MYSRRRLSADAYDMCLEEFFEGQMGKKQRVAKVSFLKQRMRSGQVFRTTGLPVFDLFRDIHIATATLLP